jgi:ATP-binding cassette subfamily B protein
VSTPLPQAGWPLERLAEAVEALAGTSRLRPPGGRAEARTPGPPPDPGNLGRWLAAVAEYLGVEAEPVAFTWSDTADCLARCGPALVQIAGGKEPRFLAILGSRGRQLELLTPEHGCIRLPLEEVRQALCQEVEAQAEPLVEQLLAAAAVTPRRARQVRRGLLRQFLGTTTVGGCWLVRPAGIAPPPVQARSLGLPRLLVCFLACHVCERALLMGAWWLLGRGALGGHLDAGWLTAWQLLLLTVIPFHLLSSYLGGRLTIRSNALVKRQLLYGALTIDRDRIRHLGAGQLLGRVLEADQAETALLGAGLLTVVGLIDLVSAGLVFAFGVRSWLGTLLLAGWSVVVAGCAYQSYRRQRRLTDERLALTNDLLEKMIGHRTRAVQEPRQRWNAGEDAALDGYLAETARWDAARIRLAELVPMGWLLVALAGLVPAYLSGTVAPGPLAAGIGAVVLALGAFRSLGQGFARLGAAAISWERIRPFWDAVSRAWGDATRTPPVAAGPTGSPPTGQPIVEARNLVFRYQARGAPVLDGASLRLFAGDRVLIEGPSGSGKSTLALALACGRGTEAGLLLHEGLDVPTWGKRNWRRRIGLVPQFHENHVLIGTFAFNALMGRRWPPGPGDLEDAERICRALDLGPLLERMPAGLFQVVGETGWQLSHGEKARLYIARALLQRPEVLLFDESFAALDPQTLCHVLGLVLKESKTLVTIAHP